MNKKMQIRVAAANLSHQAWEDIRSAIAERSRLSDEDTKPSRTNLTEAFQAKGYDEFAAMAMARLVTGGLNVAEFAPAGVS